MVIILFTIAPQANNLFPYNSVNDTFASGLDPIATAIVAAMGSGAPTIDMMNTAIISYMQSQYSALGSTLDQTQKLNAVLGNFYNAFIQPQQSALGFYTPSQRVLINNIMAGIMQIDTASGTTGSINYGQLAFENLTTLSNLTGQQQAPLSMALNMAGTTSQLFYAYILSPPSDWVPFLDPNPAVNMANLNAWTQDTFRGALIGYTQSAVQVPITAADGAGIGNNIITTLMGAFAATFGAIIFKWVKRPPMDGNGNF